MSLRDQLNHDIKSALKGGEKTRLKTLRLIQAAIKQREVDERTTLGDDDVLVVLEKMIKQRRDSVEQFRQGGREDLAAAEEAEIELLSGYLPEPLSADELMAVIDLAVAEAGAASMQDMGKVMAALKSQVQGRADMRQVSAQVKARLGG